MEKLYRLMDHDAIDTVLFDKKQMNG